MMGLAKSGCQQLFEKQMQAVRTSEQVFKMTPDSIGQTAGYRQP